MRERMLTLLAVLAVGTSSALAQPLPVDPVQPMPAPGPSVPMPPPGPAPYRGLGQQWDRSWESLVLSAGGQPPRDDSRKPPEEKEPDPPANSFWLTGDYLFWCTKDAPVPTPLLTTGPITAPTLGGLNQPGTTVVFGGPNQDYHLVGGMRFDMGGWFDDKRLWGMDAGFFFLEQKAAGLGIHSDAAGHPLLAQPLVDPATGREFTEVIALPGLLTGGVNITTHSHLQGWEINALANLFRTEHLDCDLLVGFRTAKLDEDLTVFTAFSPLVDDFLTFPGHPVNAGSTLATYDGFMTENHFYGVQLGSRVQWYAGPLTLDGLFKVAFGSEQELVRIVGESALIVPGTLPVSVPGGVLAVASNMGRHYRDEFAVLPEVDLQVKYRISAHLEARLGYSLFFLSNVARPGRQVSRSVEPGQVPTDPAFGTATGIVPTFQVQSSDYWAQGLNFGLVLRF